MPAGTTSNLSNASRSSESVESKQVENKMVNTVRCQFQKPEDRELYELVILSGLVIDPEIFSILVDLLRMDIAPSAIYTMLQVIAAHSKPPTQQKKPQGSIVSKPSSISTAGKKKPPTATKPTRKPHFADS